MNAAFLLLVPLIAQETPKPFAFTREIEAGTHTFTADFARIDVPQERSKQADGTAIQIAVCRLRSTAARPEAPLFYLTGVPNSASGMRDSTEWSDFWAEYLAIGDVVLMDQRGTGESRPPLVWDSPEWKPWLIYADRKTAYEHVLQCAAAARKELEGKQIVPASFHVNASADDVDAVRQAIGYERINLMGHSAGSHLALVYMRRHPSHVGRLVSAGTAGFDDIMKPPSDLDAALRRITTLVRKAPELKATDVDLEADLRRILADLDAQPLQVAITDPRDGREVQARLGAFGLQLLIVQDLGDDRDLVVLPRLIRSLQKREPALARWFLQKRVEQLAKLPVSLFVFRAASGASGERWKQIDREANTSLFGRVRTLFCPEISASLDVQQMDAAFYTALTSDVPALFVSGLLDANTPPEQAKRASKGFSRAVHVLVENAGHETILYEPSVRERAIAFLKGEAVKDATIPRPKLSFAPLDGPADKGLHPAIAAEGDR